MTTTAALDTFVTRTRPIPKAISASQSIRDRGSTFTGSIYRITDASSARTAVQHHTHVVHGSHRATHEISAWRTMALKHGRDGLRGPDDFEVRAGCDDDGEDYAGKKVLRVMEAEGVLDAVVIVSRWYGGTLLGPVRFTHIETCAREVCRAFKAYEEVEECVPELQELDGQLTRARAELASLSSQHEADTSVSMPVSPPKAQDYSTLLEPPDPKRAKRLLVARRSALKSVKGLIASKRTSKETTSANFDHFVA